MKNKKRIIGGYQPERGLDSKNPPRSESAFYISSHKRKGIRNYQIFTWCHKCEDILPMKNVKIYIDYEYLQIEGNCSKCGGFFIYHINNK